MANSKKTIIPLGDWPIVHWPHCGHWASWKLPVRWINRYIGWPQSHRYTSISISTRRFQNRYCKVQSVLEVLEWCVLMFSPRCICCCRRATYLYLPTHPPLYHRTAPGPLPHTATPTADTAEMKCQILKSKHIANTHNKHLAGDGWPDKVATSECSRCSSLRSCFYITVDARTHIYQVRKTKECELWREKSMIDYH